MKIVDRATFLAMPAGTVFAKYAPCYFDEMCIKGETWGRDFLTQDTISAIDSTGSGDFGDKLDDAQENGTSIPMDFDCEGRDGFFDEGQLFAVLEYADVEALIERLQRTLHN